MAGFVPSFMNVPYESAKKQQSHSTGISVNRVMPRPMLQLGGMITVCYTKFLREK